MTAPPDWWMPQYLQTLARGTEVIAMERPNPEPEPAPEPEPEQPAP
jgi:hypothetical protein